jgi:uncharacterized protein YbjT (DUF2867 family)
MASPFVGRSAEVVSVVAATGRQGGAVVRHLLRDQWRVRALTRDPSSAAYHALHQAGAELHRVDSEDVDSLRRAFDGAYGVFNVQNPMIGGYDAEVRQGRNVVKAAAEAGVSHVGSRGGRCERGGDRGGVLGLQAHAPPAFPRFRSVSDRAASHGVHGAD